MEAKMWGGVTTRSKLQNSITSLQKVHKILEAPTENPINQTTDPTHRLSPLLEKDIASNLAFLSVASDDSRKVMAVCVEEHVDGEGITIRIASNTGNPLAAADGFKRIGIILEQVARRRECVRFQASVETELIIGKQNLVGLMTLKLFFGKLLVSIWIGFSHGYDHGM